MWRREKIGGGRKIIENLLHKLVKNSKAAINDNVYEISETLPKSHFDLIEQIKNSKQIPLIAEIKFSSPSLGEIRKTTDPVKIAKSMINGGAIGLSILTQPHLFNGSPQYFMQVRKEVDIPLLMKEIIVDKIQIDAAQKIGADYILLIQSLFDSGLVSEIDEFVEYGHKKGLKILIESHTKEEFENSLKTDADILGINNRNLDTLKLDIKTTKKLLRGHTKSKIIIAESGIKSPADIKFLHNAGADAFLVGSSIMKSDNIEESVKELVNAI